jgi:hypothetical protein
MVLPPALNQYSAFFTGDGSILEILIYGVILYSMPGITVCVRGIYVSSVL